MKSESGFSLPLVSQPFCVLCCVFCVFFLHVDLEQAGPWEVGAAKTYNGNTMGNKISITRPFVIFANAFIGQQLLLAFNGFDFRIEIS